MSALLLYTDDVVFLADVVKSYLLHSDLLSAIYFVSSWTHLTHKGWQSCVGDRSKLASKGQRMLSHTLSRM